MLSEYIDHLTFIPDYIVNAIAHTSQHISDKTFLEMAKYRLKAFSKGKYDGNTTDYSLLMEQMLKFDNLDSMLDYKKKMPDDQLTKFIVSVETHRLLS
jgi:hypothetical protein